MLNLLLIGIYEGGQNQRLKGVGWVEVPITPKHSTGPVQQGNRHYPNIKINVKGKGHTIIVSTNHNVQMTSRVEKKTHKVRNTIGT